MNPLVSIITPSYNQAAYIPDAISSVLAQDYHPIEYWVIDGASTDGSQQIIERFSSRLTGWISERDSGQAEAINKGLSITKGEIVAWLNSDDLYLPQAISQAVSYFTSEPDLGLVFGDALTVDSTGRPLKTLTFGDWGLEELVKFRIICQPAVFMRRSILEKTGQLDSSYHYMLDHQLWIRLAQQAPLRYVRSWNSANRLPWAAARHHPSAKNVNNSIGFSQEIMRLLEWMNTEPALKKLITQNRRQVQAGAYRLSARYLLDGGKYRESIRSYSLAARADPIYAFRHWHRMLYAAFAWIGLKTVMDRSRLPSIRRQQLKLAGELRSGAGSSGQQLEGWPGIYLESE